MFQVSPNFDSPILFGFSTEQLNAFMRTEVYDHFSPYQKAFGLYSYMKLNKRRQFSVTTTVGNTMVWQPDNSCSFDATGGITFGQKELAPCSAKVNQEFCLPELFESCFDQMLSYENGDIKEDATMQPFMDEIFRSVAQGAMIGALDLLTMGKFYDSVNYTFGENTPLNTQDLFKKTASTCRGWVTLQKETAKIGGKTHLNLPVLSADMFVGDKFAGGLDGLLAVYEEIRSKAKPALRRAITHSHNVVFGRQRAVIVVDETMFEAVVMAYNKQCQLGAACPNTRISHTMPDATGFSYYAIDGLPVIPVSQINDNSELLDTDTHYFGITVTGNILLGSTFDEVPFPNMQNNGILFERGKTLRDSHLMTVKSNALFANTFADTDMMVGSIITLIPA